MALFRRGPALFVLVRTLGTESEPAEHGASQSLARSRAREQAPLNACHATTTAAASITARVCVGRSKVHRCVAARSYVFYADM